ncbi:MAG: acyl-ACP--UDP-N-acetylglucosamine O-acyltransferase [Phycisphaeraceae bacterium]|nr:acyl-ACP--UDP-N-acetylglucosamine O-acyltransferase [Phycisphaeraceae bacterium]
MPKIHPSSIVDPQAKLAEDVEIGPWCMVRGAVQIGKGTRLLERVSLKGPLILGERNVLYPNVSLGYEPQDWKFNLETAGAGTVIGDANLFREGVTVHRATGTKPTTIGHRNMFMVNSHAGHDVVVGNDCTLANGALLAGHVTIEDRVILGGGAGVHQFCRLGRMSMLGGGAVLVQDLPPFCLVITSRAVAGLNLVGLRRAGLRDNIAALREAFTVLYRQRLPLPRAIEVLEANPTVTCDSMGQELIAFVKTSKRGITSFIPSGRMMASEET